MGVSTAEACKIFNKFESVEAIFVQQGLISTVEFNYINIYFNTLVSGFVKNLKHCWNIELFMTDENIELPSCKIPNL